MRWLWVKTVLGSHFGVGEFSTFRTYFSGRIELDVHWGYDFVFDPWPYCDGAGASSSVGKPVAGVTFFQTLPRDKDGPGEFSGSVLRPRSAAMRSGRVQLFDDGF